MPQGVGLGAPPEKSSHVCDSAVLQTDCSVLEPVWYCEKMGVHAVHMLFFTIFVKK